MTERPPIKLNRSLLLKLAVLAVGGAVLVVLLLRGVDLKSLVHQVLSWIGSIGPAAFFAAMVIIPAFGFPLLAFTLSVGPAFSNQLGMPWVATLVSLAIALNVALTYWLARYALRPLLEGWVKKLGYSIPRVADEDHLSLIVMARVTPGVPFFVQCYLLGLAEVSFKLYMVVSVLIAVPMALSLIFFADSMVQGNGRMAVFALCLVVAISVAIQWIRRRTARRKAQLL